MIRPLILICTVFGALTLLPAINTETSVARADDSDDYWERYEHNRKEYLEDLRKQQRRNWKQYRRNSRYWNSPRGRVYYNRPPAPIYNRWNGRPYGNPYYYGPGFSVNVGGLRFGLWR